MKSRHNTADATNAANAISAANIIGAANIINAVCVALMVFCFPWISCTNAGKGSGNETAREVRTASVGLRNLSREINAFGSLVFVRKVDITSPQEGNLARLFFREGDEVVKGDLLVLLENPQITLGVGRARDNMLQAEAALALARSRLTEGEYQAEAQILSLEKAADELAQSKRACAEQERKYTDQEALFEAGGVTEEAMRTGRFALESERERIRIREKEIAIMLIGFRDFDLANAGFPIPKTKEERDQFCIRLATNGLRAELSSAEAKLDSARRELESTRLAESELKIYSPLSGTVGARYMEEGERIKREDKLLSLIDTGSLYAVIQVREADALELKKGMDALVSVDGTGKEYAGSVELVFPAADSQSFTFSARILLKDKDDLRPGMFARVSVKPGASRDVICVPETSLFFKDKREGALFVVSNGRAMRRNLVLGDALGEDREIVSGLEAGEVVILRPDKNLRDGEYVSVVM